MAEFLLGLRSQTVELNSMPPLIASGEEYGMQTDAFQTVLNILDDSKTDQLEIREEPIPTQPLTSSSGNGGDVIIPPQTDINDLGDDDSDAQRIRKEDEEKRRIPEALYDKLPPLVKAYIAIFFGWKDKEIALFSFFGVISSAIPNCVGKYAGKKIRPNLLVFIVGWFGSGKGIASFAKKLVIPIHDRLRKASDTEKQQYEEDMAEYEKESQAYKSGKTQEKPEKPKRPGRRILFMSSNITKTLVLKLLLDNYPFGMCIHDTEGDSYAASQKLEVGNYHDLYRKSFENEAADVSRVTEDLHIEVPEVILSSCMSMTPSSLPAVIGDARNGAFSRITPYCVPPEGKFHNVWDENVNAYDEKVEELSVEFSKLFEMLSKRPADNPYQIKPKEHQIPQFLRVFQQQKSDYLENMDVDFVGMVHRAGVMVFKIIMILTVLRNYSDGTLEDVMECHDDDFEFAMEFVKIAQRHSLHLYNQMPKTATKPVQANDKELNLKDQLEYRKRARKLHDEGMSYRQISVELYGTTKKKSNIFRWLN